MSWPGELSMDSFHLFEAGIDNEISSFKLSQISVAVGLKLVWKFVYDNVYISQP